MAIGKWIAGLTVATCTMSALLLTGMGAERAAGKVASLSREQEQRILDHLDWMFKNQSQDMLNIPPEDGKLLRVFAQSTNARNVVEIGTSNGYSGIWLCLGLVNAGGHLTTFDIDAERLALAKENFKKAGVEDMVEVVKGDAHEQVLKLSEPIDLLFIDADKPGYVDYLKTLLPLVRPGGLILAHNTINNAPDLKEYVQAITTNPNLETVFVNATERGMAVSMKKR